MADLLEHPNHDTSLYIYVPLRGPGIVFAVVFAISGLWHLWQCYAFKAFRVMALHPFTCLMFVAGFALREYAAEGHWRLYQQNVDPLTVDRPNLNVYIASQVMIYFSPPLLELANYHVFGRILYYVPYFSPIHPGRTLTTFIFLSGIVEILNALGVVWASALTAGNFVQVGSALLKASLIFQVVVIIFFLSLVGLFHYRCAKHNFNNRSVMVPIFTMYASTLAIGIRCIFRLIENFEDRSHPASAHEWYFLVFEATMMAINELLWNGLHPRRFLPERFYTYLAQDGQTELRGKGWKDDRNLFLTIIDPFGCMNNKSSTPFWETNGYHHHLTGAEPPKQRHPSSSEEDTGTF